MSESNDGLALPNVDDAQAVLDSVYQEAFFAKMAEYGHMPSTEEDAIAMLEVGYQLDQIPEEKTANDNAGYYSAANAQLKEALASYGIDTGLSAPSQDIGIKQAAFALAQDADFYKSVLAIRAAEQAANDAD